jgi:hypothetical protein
MIIKRYINGRPLPTSDNKPKEATPAKKQTVKPNNAPPAQLPVPNAPVKKKGGCGCGRK